MNILFVLILVTVLDVVFQAFCRDFSNIEECVELGHMSES